MVAEPDARVASRGRIVTGMGDMCTTGNRGIDRVPWSTLQLGSSSELSSFASKGAFAFVASPTRTCIEKGCRQC